MARKPNAAFMKPLAVSADLAAVIGSGPYPRTEVTGKIWEYIKKHNLQDSKDKRLINADDKLKKVFNGQSQVHMMKMAGLISKHLS
jgi:upstream activation factor subunit UAF30